MDQKVMKWSLFDFSSCTSIYDDIRHIPCCVFRWN